MSTVINSLILLITKILRRIYVTSVNIIINMVKNLRQTCMDWSNTSVRSVINHCLYNHEMENVPIYMKMSVAIVVTTVTIITIVYQAQAGRYRPGE